MAKRITIAPVKTTVSYAVEAAMSMVTEIADEFQEYVDSVSGTGLENTERTQQWSEAADALSGLSEPDVPECVEALEVEYTPTRIPNYESAVGSRRLRKQDAVDMLTAAMSVADGHKEELEDKLQKLAENKQNEADGVDVPSVDEVEEDEADLNRQVEEIETFASTMEDLISEIGGVEF